MSYSPLVDSETESLSGFVRSQAKYGSTANHKDSYANQTTKHIKHMVSSADTLQGLALKYGVTIEQIKRANNLWSSDNQSLRSRISLNIPIGEQSRDTNASLLYCRSSDSSRSQHSHINNGSQSLESDDIPLDDDHMSATVRDSNHGSHDRESRQMRIKNGFKKSSLLAANDVQSSNFEQLMKTDESAADFLIRIDSSIAKTKDKVKIMQQNRVSGTHSDDDLFRLHQPNRFGLRRHHSTNSPKNANTSSSLDDINNDLPQPLVMTHGRKVISSMKRMERANDEIFQL